MGETLGYRQVGKTADFDSAIRWSESGYPNEKNKHLQKMIWNGLTNQKKILNYFL